MRGNNRATVDTGQSCVTERKIGDRKMGNGGERVWGGGGAGG